VAVRLPKHALYLALVPPALCVIRSAPAVGQSSAGLEPQSRRIETFPKVNNLKSVVILLSHTGGAFSFPCAYSLKITGEGIVEYHGEHGYYVTGPHRDWITDEEVLKLVEAFREADFYSLEDESQMIVMDAGSTAISLTIGDRMRRVVNRIGESHRFNQLAERIEQLSHAEKWLIGNAETVPSLLADKDNLNVPDDEGETVLMWACKRTDAVVVQKFLAAGANLHARDRYGRTALMYAVVRGVPEAVEVLLQAGADAKESDAGGETPLIYAVGIRDVWFGRWFSAAGESSSSWWPIISLFGDPSPEVIQMLLRAGADPNASDSEGATPLMYAAQSFKGGTDILCMLVDGGANPNQQDDEGRTALMRTADQYRVDAVRFLIAAKADVNLRDSKGRTALGRLSPPRNKLFRHFPEYKQIRLLLKQAGAVR
jgi:ankyrin repeat protein/uncharacterized protein DUF6438